MGLDILCKQAMEEPNLDVLTELRKYCYPPGIYFGLDADH